MATKKKMLQAAAGNATGGAGLNVEDVFSTTLYEGNDTYNRTIDTGIDFVENEGLVWIKQRNTSGNHYLVDTIRGVSNSGTSAVYTNSIQNSNPLSGYFNSFETNGIEIDRNSDINGLNDNFVCYSFRQHKKFFDVVTWTGTNGTRQIPHDLQGEIGFIAIKRTDATDEWAGAARKSNGVYSVWITDPSYALFETDAPLYDDTGNVLGNNVPSYTDTYFTVGTSFTGDTNTSGATYVAYIFAHNDGDGEFGPDGDADIIKCGSYTGSGAGSLPNFIDLGFEPQWVMIKNTTDSNTSWAMFDNMRALSLTGTARLIANSNAAEYNDTAYNAIAPTPTGFNLTNGESWYNASGKTYIYIAIRKGPMAVPESATDVFSVDLWSGTAGTKVTTGFPVDMQVNARRDGSNHAVVDRVRGVHSTAATGGGFPTLYTNLYNVEITTANTTRYWDNTGYQEPSYGNNSSNSYVSYSWRRAPNYFDAVAYTGTGSVRTVSHNLGGVAPEMMWIKRRNTVRDWSVYHSALGATKYIILNDSGTPTTVSSWWNDTEPTSSDFTTGGSVGVNGLNDTYIAYLFASLDGVSKVGSYTGTGAAGNQIDCGFSSGARFVLIKQTNSTGNWHVFDTERGIVTGNDSRLALDNSNAEGTNLDLIDPYASGFELGTSSNAVNGSGDTYIFYAIA